MWSCGLSYSLFTSRDFFQSMQQITGEVSRNLSPMMRKRRAESSSIQESPLPHPLPPQKKKKRSCVCDAGRELEPALFTTVYGEGCRKRPGCCEDHEQHCKIMAPGGKLRNVTDDVKKETENERVSRKFRGASDACTREMTSEESTRSNVDKRTKVTLCDVW